MHATAAVRTAAAASPASAPAQVAPRSTRERPTWHARLLLLHPERVLENLDRLEARGLIDRRPNLWQVEQGVLRMWHRILFRSETIGTARAPKVRGTLRARLLDRRFLRFPFLLAEGAIAPWDTSGLITTRERMIRHLLGAYHDRTQFIYDLEILAAHEGALEELVAKARDVVSRDAPRSRWLRDLVVYEGYHERLLERLEQVLAEGLSLTPEEEADPDISFLAFVRWCAARPTTPRESLEALRRGELAA